MSSGIFVFFGLILFGIEYVYFRLANYYKIVDKPNERSLHVKPTIRGGGVIFPIAVAIYFLVFNYPSFSFLLGLVAVSVIGFLDDIKSLKSLTRFIVQSLAIGLMIYDLGIFSQYWWISIITFVVVTGTLNAYNFMDGINGLTAGYSAVIMFCLLYINSYVVHFTETNLIVIFLISLFVFGYFNFRKVAICFAGDVGSMACGFFVIYLILDLIYSSHNYVYILFLAVYGVDSVLTIVHRLILKQNIFKPHKLHLYQQLISIAKFNHLQMTFIYMMIQSLVCLLVIFIASRTILTQYWIGLATLLFLGATYLFVKFKILKAHSSANVS
jgi:UDP-N-acetylmuramyl pentapeptide phosphotransferase/UDP-N-acetylglucosamine-1-phosphate transferase